MVSRLWYPDVPRAYLLNIAADRCAMLLAINPEIEQRRTKLKKEKFTLQKAQEWLQGLTDTDSDGLHLTRFEI